jgi:gliding motility-associated-like protein
MKKPLCFSPVFIAWLLMTWLAGSSGALGQAYSLQGSARAIGDDCYRITDGATFQNGTIWYQKKIDVATSFDLEVSIKFGNNDAFGADGVVFVLQTQGSNALGLGGQGIGFKGFSPSLGIEFDTYQNKDENDPEYDHIAVVRDGIVNHAGGFNLAGPVQTSATNPNVEDGAEHLVRISWIAPRKILEVYFDCEKRISTPIDMFAIFGKQTSVYWGFTGATGDAFNEQIICIKKNIVVQDTFAICKGESLQLAARNSPDGTYAWNPAAALDNASSRNPTARPDRDQLFVVEYRDFCNQMTRDSIFVRVNPTPTFELGPDRLICTDSSSWLSPQQLNSTSRVYYRWTTGDTTRNLQVSASGTYGLAVREGECTHRDSIQVEIRPLPQLPASYKPLVLCLGSQPLALVSVAVGEALTYQWPHSGETQARVFVEKKGTYEVTVADRFGCWVTESFVVAEDCPLPLWVPDAFSPNADGQNDELRVYAAEDVKVKFWVYDRWGRVVFFSASKEVGWDGSFQGLRCPPDAYTWRAEYGASGRAGAEFYSKRGVVWLMR